MPSKSQDFTVPRGVKLSKSLDQKVADYCRTHNLMRNSLQWDGRKIVKVEVPNISEGIRIILEKFLNDQEGLRILKHT